MNIIQIGPDGGVTRWLTQLGNVVIIVDEVAKDIEKVMKPDLVVFTGGSDVSPWLYNHVNEASGNNAKRDAKEVLWYHKFYNVPKLGICRGAQFLNVMNGGTMIQDVQGHAIAGTHRAKDTDYGLFWDVTSTHHQMMVPRKNVNTFASKEENCGAARGKFESEVLYYGTSLSLCFQPHPEFEKATGKETYVVYGTNNLLHVCLKRAKFPNITKNLKFKNQDLFEEAEPAPQPQLINPLFNIARNNIAFPDAGAARQVINRIRAGRVAIQIPQEDRFQEGNIDEIAGLDRFADAPQVEEPNIEDNE
jgi:GMP synthase-like glutamine amidotransferase